MSMRYRPINLLLSKSWSISTALCVLSGNNEIGSFSAIVWSFCCWAPGHGDCPVTSSRLSDQRQRRPDDRKCWAGNVVLSGDVEWLTVNAGNVWVNLYAIRLIILCSADERRWRTDMQNTTLTTQNIRLTFAFLACLPFIAFICKLNINRLYAKAVI